MPHPVRVLRGGVVTVEVVGRPRFVRHRCRPSGAEVGPLTGHLAVQDRSFGRPSDGQVATAAAEQQLHLIRRLVRSDVPLLG